MKWSRPEQLMLTVALSAALAAGVLLLAIRRPSPPVRFIESPVPTELVVQLDGEVARPGLYRLPSGSRVADAVDAAGGPTEQADLNGLNRARLLRDGDRVSIPPRSAGSATPQAAHGVNLNTASAEQLEALPGIGPVLARRIVEYRVRHGPFPRLEELLQVEGIGPKLLQELRPHVIVE